MRVYSNRSSVENPRGIEDFIRLNNSIDRLPKIPTGPHILRVEVKAQKSLTASLRRDETGNGIRS